MLISMSHTLQMCLTVIFIHIFCTTTLPAYEFGDHTLSPIAKRFSTFPSAPVVKTDPASPPYLLSPEEFQNLRRQGFTIWHEDSQIIAKMVSNREAYLSAFIRNILPHIAKRHLLNKEQQSATLVALAGEWASGKTFGIERYLELIQYFIQYTKPDHVAYSLKNTRIFVMHGDDDRGVAVSLERLKELAPHIYDMYQELFRLKQNLQATLFYRAWNTVASNFNPKNLIFQRRKSFFELYQEIQLEMRLHGFRVLNYAGKPGGNLEDTFDLEWTGGRLLALKGEWGSMQSQSPERRRFWYRFISDNKSREIHRLGLTSEGILTYLFALPNEKGTPYPIWGEIEFDPDWNPKLVFRKRNSDHSISMATTDDLKKYSEIHERGGIRVTKVTDAKGRPGVQIIHGENNPFEEVSRMNVFLSENRKSAKIQYDGEFPVTDDRLNAGQLPKPVLLHHRFESGSIYFMESNNLYLLQQRGQIKGYELYQKLRYSENVHEGIYDDLIQFWVPHQIQMWRALYRLMTLESGSKISTMETEEKRTFHHLLYEDARNFVHYPEARVQVHTLSREEALIYLWIHGRLQSPSMLDIYEKDFRQHDPAAFAYKIERLGEKAQKGMVLDFFNQVTDPIETRLSLDGLVTIDIGNNLVLRGHVIEKEGRHVLTVKPELEDFYKTRIAPYAGASFIRSNVLDFGVLVIHANLQLIEGDTQVTRTVYLEKAFLQERGQAWQGFKAKGRTLENLLKLMDEESEKINQSYLDTKKERIREIQAHAQNFIERSLENDMNLLKLGIITPPEHFMIQKVITPDPNGSVSPRQALLHPDMDARSTLIHYARRHPEHSSQFFDLTTGNPDYREIYRHYFTHDLKQKYLYVAGFIPPRFQPLFQTYFKQMESRLSSLLGGISWMTDDLHEPLKNSVGNATDFRIIDQIKEEFSKSDMISIKFERLKERFSALRQHAYQYDFSQLKNFEQAHADYLFPIEHKTKWVLAWIYLVKETITYYDDASKQFLDDLYHNIIEKGISLEHTYSLLELKSKMSFSIDLLTFEQTRDRLILTAFLDELQHILEGDYLDKLFTRQNGNLARQKSS